MPAAPLPSDENLRLEALYGAALVDTRNEFFFEEAVDAALHAVPAPIALVSLVDESRQWFKARRGLQVSETPREYAFCAHAILNDSPLAVADAREDERFKDNPLVTGEPHVIAYAGAPIILNDGARLGTVCVIDHKPRAWTSQEIFQLSRISRLVSAYIELRRSLLANHPQRYLDLTLSGENLPDT
jgi:GAF domain-containing protein